MALIEVLLNGEAKILRAGMTMAELIDELGLAPERLAVEYNLEILKKKRWGETALSPGDRIEIVHFVGGGAGIFHSRPQGRPWVLKPGRTASRGDLRGLALKGLLDRAVGRLSGLLVWNSLIHVPPRVKGPRHALF